MAANSMSISYVLKLTKNPNKQIMLISCSQKITKHKWAVSTFFFCLIETVTFNYQRSERSVSLLQNQ